MSGQVLTRPGRKRLEELRRVYGASLYAPEQETWAADDTDAVGLQIDVTGWVVDVRVNRLDVVLLDVHLPGGGGVEVMRRAALKGSPPTRAISRSR